MRIPLMVVEGESAEPMFSKYSSFKDAVTNLDSMSHFSENDWEEEYFDLDDRDLLRKMVDGMPTLDFSERLYSLIEKSMSSTIVLKLLGKRIGVNTLWSKEFPENVVTWIHVLSLLGVFYKRSVLRAIGELVGKVFKIVLQTDKRVRGQFANCSTYGHMRENCAKVHNAESMEEESDMANENLVRMKQQLEISTQVRVEKEEGKGIKKWDVDVKAFSSRQAISGPQNEVDLRNKGPRVIIGGSGHEMLGQEGEDVVALMDENTEE
ncbi:hypothetical protein GOBAR_AA34891 [Gossypium barbadense]|uniref:DUF4283 domain-containing protein n=1 Tax=Gossypium barbadense TaxID=3634 RepID=A0A2P5W3X6_GOSBA|nr:hypothetical protein GOBAR_AA34891 [Gossypium barbadense]